MYASKTNIQHQPNIQVRLKNDMTRIGITTGKTMQRRGRLMYQVRFNEGPTWHPEDQLEVVEEVRMSPLDMLESGKFGRPVDLRRTLTHVKLSGRLANVIYSMEATNTDFYAYQFKPVLKVMESPSNSVLIADEVGLGKTIEAGLIWTELRSRFDMRRLLVICPAALREKWAFELSSKIGVPAQICGAKEVLDVLKDQHSKVRGFALVASIQGLRPPRNWEDESNRSATAELARFVFDKENEDKLVDLLVIDEAHHLRNPETRTHALGRFWRSVSEYSVFLSATPIHNRNEDLFSLLRLLDPDTFERREAFQQILEANRPLIKARDLVLTSDCNAWQLQSLLDEALEHPLLQNNRQLELINASGLSEANLAQRDFRSRLAYRLETVNLLAHVVTRTRKRDVKEWRVVRDPYVEYVPRTFHEERFYEVVSDVVRKYASTTNLNDQFLLAQPQRLMTSSMAAALRSWQRKSITLEEMQDDDEYYDGVDKKKIIGPLLEEIVSRSDDYVDLDRLIEDDTKYQRLNEIIVDYLEKHPEEKIVLFSAFRATLEYLAERLEADGISCIQLKGGQKETKDETIQAFKKHHGPSVLLSSEVGGEGVDLQFSRIVINYDIPWNPMRLEQRIGRIDRLGQEAKRIIIWNILFEDTIDARIYRRLYEKLDLCHVALGDFESILSDQIRKLEKELLSGLLTPEQQEKCIDQTAQALENLRQEEQRLEQDASSLVAYGDYILNQVQASRELNRWISGEDIQRYVIDYLRRNYQGCEFKRISADDPLYDIDLSHQAKHDLREYMTKNKLIFDTRLVSAHKEVRCRFENRITGAFNQMEETISQFHPLVRMISQQIYVSGEQLTPAVSLKLNQKCMDFHMVPGCYVLAVSLWSFAGLQDTEKLSYAAASLEMSETLLSNEQSEKLAVAAVAHGEDWLEGRNKIDLDKAFFAANEHLFGSMDEAYEVFRGELIAKNEDRADIQMRSLTQHFVRQLSNLEEVKRTHIHHGRKNLISATEGKIKALRSRYVQQKLKIESRRNVNSESREIAVAVIQVYQ